MSGCEVGAMRKLENLAGRYLIPIAVDAVVVAGSLFLAWTGRSITADLEFRSALIMAGIAAVVICASNYAFGFYHRLWRYAAAAETLVIAASVLVSTTLLILADVLIIPWPGNRRVPVSVLLFMGFFAFVGFVSVRYRGRVLRGLHRWGQLLRGRLLPVNARVIIVGAGEAGQLLAWRMLNHRSGEGYQVVGFVDDDPAMVGMRVHGIPVLGGRHAIPELVRARQADLIVIAIYSITRQDFRDIVAICERTSARIKVLPDVFAFLGTTEGGPPIRDITTEDLLGRQPVEVDYDACRHLLAGKVVLVTGAAGSIGSELCRQVLPFGPRCLLMLDNNESGLHDLLGELQDGEAAAHVRAVIGDVTNRAKMEAVFRQHRPQVVFHAAAYKHVPLMEEFPEEAVRTNVLGTLIAGRLACQHGAERFVLISTDKAVSPTSIMGATKRLGELIVAGLDSGAATLCTGVRFGNVLGSRGSVVPTFERQIAQGGPVTITHPEMTRFFMTIAEAVSLVIQAATLTEGGDLFVLDMGEQVRIEDLASRLIRLRGLRPGVDIPIKYTGIRPGEKLHEVLIDEGEGSRPTAHPAISRLESRQTLRGEALYAEIGELIALAEGQQDGLLEARLWQIVGRGPYSTLTRP